MGTFIFSLSVGIISLSFLQCQDNQIFFVVYSIVGKNTENRIYTNATSAMLTRDYFSCGGFCLMTHGCVSVFFNTKDHQCVLQQDIVALNEVIGESNWTYLVRREAIYREPKKPTLLVFNGGPTLVDPKTWNVTRCKTSKPWQPGSAAYHSETLTLYWSGLSPGTGLLATGIGHVNDLTNPRTVQLTNQIVQGISIDPHQGMLVYLTGREVVARSLTDGKTDILTSFPNKKPFETFCRTAIFTSRRLFFFHYNKEKKLYGSSYEGKCASSATKEIVTNLVSDEIGLKLWWTALDKKSIWSMDVRNFNAKKCFADIGVHYVYPAPAAWLMWNYKRKSFYVMYRDQKKNMEEISLNSTCQHSDCNITTIVQLLI